MYLHPFFLRQLQNFESQLLFILLYKGISYISPLCFNEGIGHSAPNYKMVHLIQYILYNGNFGRNFCATQNCCHRFFRIPQNALKALYFLCKQKTETFIFEVIGNDGGGSMCPVGCPKSVIHINITQVGKLLREGGVSLFFLRMESQVLK